MEVIHEEKRALERHPVALPVECRMLEPGSLSQVKFRASLRDIHSAGLCLVWEAAGQEEKSCPACGHSSASWKGHGESCPYRIFEDHLQQGARLQIYGLDRISGLEHESEIYARVVWCSDQNPLKRKHVGLKFDRRLSTLTLENPSAEAGKKGRRPAGEETAGKDMLVFDPDKFDVAQIFSLAKRFGWTAQNVTFSPDAAKAIGRQKPGIIFVNPILNGSLNMDLVRDVRQSHPNVFLALVLEEPFRSQAMNCPEIELVNSIFVKPLDLDRIEDVMSKFFPRQFRLGPKTDYYKN